MDKSQRFIPYEFEAVSESEMIDRASKNYQFVNKRRSIRHFSDRDVPLEVMQNIIMSAGTAPSGAHKQPWTFCLIGNPEQKKAIREAAEKEEYENYHGRMSEEWLKDLEQFDTDWHKEFLETVPWIIVIFKKSYDMSADGKMKNYYVNESVGIACGMLINAIHNAGLATLTHTPSPMNFLHKLLDRPDNERPFLLLPVGYPANECEVPNIKRKSFEEICVMFD